MLQRRVGIASRSQTVGLRDIIKVASALNLQANRDLQNIWSISASVRLSPILNPSNRVCGRSSSWMMSDSKELPDCI
jgi:hypothetical protein